MGSWPRHILIGLWCCLLLAGCGSRPTQPDEVTTLTADDTVEHAHELLQRAENAPPDEKLRLQLSAAKILANRGETDWARSIINNLPASEIPKFASDGESYGILALINSDIARAEGSYPAALQYLGTYQLMEALPSYDTKLAAAIRQQRAKLLFDLQDYPAAVDERIALRPLLADTPEADTENNERIWASLMEIPFAELEQLANREEQEEQRGWYQLAALSKNNQTNLKEQVQAVELWARNWPYHPASVQLPADLQLLQQLLENQPQHIAVILPFTGKFSHAASAIREGIMAAFYQHKSRSDDYPTIRFYNSERENINQLYDRAINAGAELVIGPLSKDNILELALRPEMPVPTLALNTIENPLGVVPKLYQFGLGIEDEATQAAEQAWRDGHRRALAIVPMNTWGDRSINAFQTTWEGLGGELLGQFRFEDNNDYSSVLKQAFQVDRSEQRARDIRRIVGSIEFQPRRRQDVDTIFLAAHAEQARQVKPTLAFHFAGDIPVYATSQVFTGRTDPKADQDMNGVRFSTLPWFFNDSLPEREALNQYADPSANLQTLYALGVDSYHLFPRLEQLATIKNASYYGQTGRLSLNEMGQFQRKQQWAEFVSGRPQQLHEHP